MMALNTSRGRIGAATIALLGAVSVTACSPGGLPADSTMARLADAGEITIGIKYDQPLFGEMGTDGVPEGFDVEVGRIVADELGIDEDGITWVEAPSGQREDLLSSGAVDIVVATYTISDERKERVGFAGPYYVAGQSLMTRTSDAEIASALDLAGKQVCSVEGATAADTIARVAPEASLVLYDDYSDCIEPLRTGQVDVVTTDDVILAAYAADAEGQFKIVGGAFTAEPYGIGVALEDDDFRLWIDDVLEEAMEDGRWLDAWSATAGAILPEPQVPHLDRYEAE
ncbi:glutamate ABC transporter substrate-binding protein [Demequina litorisediminis]|uniref:ABC transporter substrate-binding protein n=1 Tax=Demequina litorisediminis TaxID=1849022 RepID=A0ABQ6IGP2_9MICO|nr:glutamate ABC transporter substrate-binding protein [Demequina litorisediminis]GMA37077.1 ABC transporter substrate-binding protein [Demequina litorisediminis]